MKLVLVNYHQTLSDRTSGTVYDLSHAELDRQLALIAEAGLSVVLPSRTPEAPGTAARAVGLTFDDGNHSDLRNAMRIAERGWRAMFFVSSAMVGEPGYLSRGDITAMVRAGMAIGSHSHDHVRLTTMPLAQAASQLKRSKAILEDITGTAVDQLAFPGGAFRADVVGLAREAGFHLLHGTAWGANRWPAARADEAWPVLRRNNVLSGMADHAFLDLVTGRDAARRAVVYGLKTAARAVVPERLYGRLRQAVSGASH